MNQVVAKFKVNSVEDFGGSKRAKLTAVYDPNGEYKDFTKYTPSGELTIMITAEAPANTFFVPGDTITLTFSK
ncbi:hypothetical protein [Chitinophaga sp. LS1]|uniref:hypothetical protein n=1 Tax=Chitinophaga sp. LS1 TaxID=3051176 RepID=UPI002AABF6B7|nr:hypothetical protein [Chitinophaga sp. LS1]WPV66291.1 hypothetical protein QQL36_31325 [Chitinophaga sp. LS1]